MPEYSAERVAWRVLKSDELHGFIAENRLDEGGARAVGALRDLPDDRRSLEGRAAIGEWPDDHQSLSRLYVQRHLHRQLRVKLHPPFEIH